MKQQNKILLFVGVNLILLTGLFLSSIYLIKNLKQKVLGANISTTELKRENLIFPEDTELQQFYEPKPDSIQKEKMPWDKNEATYTINSDSLNERFDYNFDKDGKYRIVTIGDSFTFGAFVNTSENWTEKLEDMLNNNTPCENITNFEVINLGVGGYDFQSSAHRFKVRGQKYNPDLVIWLLIDNDIQDIREYTAPRVFELYDSLSEEEKNKFPSKWELPLKIADSEFYDKYGEEQILKMQKSFFIGFSEIYKETLLFVTFESFSTKYRDLLNSWVLDRPNSYYFDNLHNLSNEHIFPDFHPNTKGHADISENLYDYISTKKDILKCNEIKE